MADILWPMDYIEVTGEWANSPGYYAQFGQRGHNGIDLGTKHAPGMPVYSTDAGVVEFEGWGQNHPWMGQIAGICVILRHWWGYSGYAHLSSTVVNRGQSVARGQHIGFSGATGVGTGPHLHFETFPPNPNFANGFAGRVNPRTHNLQRRGSAPSPGPNPQPNQGSTIGKDETMLLQDQSGIMYVADEMGFSKIGDIAPSKDNGETVYAARTLFNGGKQEPVVNARQRDLINSLARNRWDVIRSQIVADVVARVAKPTVDSSAIAKAVVKEMGPVSGGSVDVAKLEAAAKSGAEKALANLTLKATK